MKKKIFTKATYIFMTIMVLFIPFNLGVAADDECICGSCSEVVCFDATNEIAAMHSHECDCCHLEEGDHESEDEDGEDEIIMRASTECQWYGHSLGAMQYGHNNSGGICIVTPSRQCTRSGCSYYETYAPTTCTNPLHTGGGGGGGPLPGHCPGYPLVVLWTCTPHGISLNKCAGCGQEFGGCSKCL
ncbi:MAG: hypothetical protein FWG34_02285 [Oscillospiraceae bacterium]|nr:hypothetical protein [Oscillospiraceae bacterium]